jgi:hypothetical protein
VLRLLLPRLLLLLALHPSQPQHICHLTLQLLLLPLTMYAHLHNFNYTRAGALPG